MARGADGGRHLPILKLLRKYGKATKIVSATTSGCSDIIACINGFYLGVEVKSIKGMKVLKARDPLIIDLQDIGIQRAQKAGGMAIKAVTPEDVMPYIQQLLNRVWVERTPYETLDLESTKAVFSC